MYWDWCLLENVLALLLLIPAGCIFEGSSLSILLADLEIDPVWSPWLNSQSSLVLLLSVLISDTGTEILS